MHRFFSGAFCLNIKIVPCYDAQALLLQVIASDVTELLHLLVASEHLQIESVRDLCVQRLQQRLDLPNALKVRLFSIFGHTAAFEAHLIDTICSHSEDIRSCVALQFLERISSMRKAWKMH